MNFSLHVAEQEDCRPAPDENDKLNNLKAAVALHFAHCNVVRVHRSLRITPAKAAGVTNRLWTLKQLMEQPAMNKAKVTAPLVVAIIGVAVAVNTLSNPRLATLQGPDILKLIAIGWCFGIAFGLLVADRVSGSKKAQS